MSTFWELKERISNISNGKSLKKVKPYIPEKACKLVWKKNINFNQSSLPEQKKGVFLLLRAQKTFPAVKRKHKPPAITHSHLKRAARASNSEVMANQNLN